MLILVIEYTMESFNEEDSLDCFSYIERTQCFPASRYIIYTRWLILDVYRFLRSIDIEFRRNSMVGIDDTRK